MTEWIGDEVEVETEASDYLNALTDRSRRSHTNVQTRVGQYGYGWAMNVVGGRSG